MVHIKYTEHTRFLIFHGLFVLYMYRIKHIAQEHMKDMYSMYSHTHI